MSLFGIVTVIFAENMVAIFGLAAFAYLLREYSRRKRRFLLFFALQQLLTALSFISLFIGQVASIFFTAAHGEAFTAFFWMFFALEPVLLALVGTEVFFKDKVSIRNGLTGAASILALVFFLLTPKSVVMISDFAVPDVSVIGGWPLLGFWVIANLSLLFFPRLAVRRGAAFREVGSEIWLAAGGLFGLLSLAITLFALICDLPAVFGAVLILLAARSVTLFFGGAALDRSDRQTRLNPALIFRRSIIMKFSLLNALLFWTLSFLIVLSIVDYFSLVGQLGSHDILRSTIAVVSIVSILASVFTAITIVAALALFRPLMELRDAARRTEKGQYDARVLYDAQDDLGELARAFNRMVAAVGDRTQRLKRTLQEERDFMIHTAHEMRTPLNIFRWTTEMMSGGDTGRLTREQSELVEQMHQTTMRLLALVQNLSDAAGLEGGQLLIKRDFHAVEEAVDEATGILVLRAHEKGIKLQWSRPRKALPKAYCDRDRLVQILLNLVSNAVKFTQRAGRIEVRVSERDDSGPGGTKGRWIEVEVEDNGRGIPVKEQARIFTRFFRSPEVVKQEIEGTGLGLYITKDLVERHGGRIWFESKEGAGTTFHFTLPVEKEGTASETKT